MCTEFECCVAAEDTSKQCSRFSHNSMSKDLSFLLEGPYRLLEIKLRSEECKQAHYLLYDLLKKKNLVLFLGDIWWYTFTSGSALVVI